METAFLVAFPFLAGLTCFLFSNQHAKYIAFLFSLSTLAIVLYLLANFCHCGTVQFVSNASWIPSLGINFNVGMDGISILLVLLTTLLVPLIILSTFKKEISNTRLFYFLVLAMEAALIGVFVSRDGFLFYVFWELALIPIYFICLIWGGYNKNKITFKFFIYTLGGSLFMLLALVFLYVHNPMRTFNIEELYATGASLDIVSQTIVFWALFLAFAIKMPIFPFHTWQPATYTVAPTAGTMLLSGIMLKMGIYGVIRWIYPVVPAAFERWASIAILLSVIGIIYASIIALKQNHLKTLIAYVSIAHVGIIGTGVFIGSIDSLQGAIIQMIAHGVNVVGLFFIIQMIHERTGTYDISALGGIRSKAPQLSICFFIILLSSVALPLTAGFTGEFLLFTGLFVYQPIIAAIAGFTIVFGAAYMLNSFQKVMLGETNETTKNLFDLNIHEKTILIPIIVFIFWIGIYPDPFFKISESSVKILIDTAKQGVLLYQK